MQILDLKKSITDPKYSIVIDSWGGVVGQGKGRRPEFSVAMALLLEGGVHPLSSVTNKNNKSVVHVKLTDSALKCFEDIARQKVYHTPRFPSCWLFFRRPKNHFFM